MPCHCAAALRSSTRRAEMHVGHMPLRRSVGDIGVSKQLCVYHLYLQKHVSVSNAYQIVLFSAFQTGISNPLIKTALRLSSAKITLKVVWKP